ncbi:head GIN domain-containing protein [Pyxidicoccus sp. 3LG]
MRMDRYGVWAGLTLLAAVITGCVDGPYVEGSGRLVAEQRQTPDFVGLEVGDGIEARVVVDPEQPVQVVLVGDDNLVALMRTELLSRDRLRVFFQPGEVGEWDSPNPLRVEVTVPRLESLNHSGGGDMDIRGALDSESFSLTASGGGRIRVSGLDTEHLDLSTSGGVDVTLEGEATEVKSVMSGGSLLRARELSAREATLRCSGGTNVSMRVSDTLRVQASGGGTVRIVGQPQVSSRELSGGASLTFE